MIGSVESLEARRLLAAYARYDDARRVLRLFGTESDDQIGVIVESADRVIVSLGAADATPLEFGRGALRNIRVYLGDGRDTLNVTGTASASFETPMIIDAGAGNDTIVSGAGNDILLGGSGADDLRAGFGEDTIDAGGGNDRIRPGAPGKIRNFESVLAGSGNDRIYTPDDAMADIYGGAGNDTLFGGMAGDSFTGDAGEDTIDYSSRRDAVYVEISDPAARDERLSRSLGNNQPRYRNNNLFDDGRAGFDETVESPGTVPFGVKADPSFIRVTEIVAPPSTGYYGTGSLEGDLLGSVERILGGSGNDTMVGSRAREIFFGNAGNDLIFAGGGQDDCYGGDGDDRILAADTRDAFPISVPDGGRIGATDLIDGGEGADFARVDARDFGNFRSSIETVETLRALTS